MEFITKFDKDDGPIKLIEKLMFLFKYFLRNVMLCCITEKEERSIKINRKYADPITILR